jgi:hypothetical protein
MFPLTGLDTQTNNLVLDVSAFDIVTDDIAVKGALHNILYTKLGERAMEPSFGIDLNRYQFELMTAETLASLQATLNRAFTIWDPRFRCAKLGINSGGNNELVINADIAIDGIPYITPVVIRKVK